MLQNEQADVARLRAERHAQTDLARRPATTVRHHAINADSGEKEREHAKTSERARRNFRREKRDVHVLSERFRVVKRQRRIELSQIAADRREDGTRIASRSRNQ